MAPKKKGRDECSKDQSSSEGQSSKVNRKLLSPRNKNDFYLFASNNMFFQYGLSDFDYCWFLFSAVDNFPDYVMLLMGSKKWVFGTWSENAPKPNNCTTLHSFCSFHLIGIPCPYTTAVTTTKNPLQEVDYIFF